MESLTLDKKESFSSKEKKNSTELIEQYRHKQRKLSTKLKLITKEESLSKINFDESYFKKIDKRSEGKLNLSIETLSQHLEYKEKVALYAKIANLAYADYEIGKEIKITKVYIDILEYPYIAGITKNPTLNDKKFIVEMQKNLHYASNGYFPTITPYNFRDYPQTFNETLKYFTQKKKEKINRDLKHLKKFKIVEFTKEKSGFAAVAFEGKNKNIYIGIRGTEFTGILGKQIGKI